MIAFYVSSHGFGHATRTAAVIQAVQERRPDLPIAVRTQAPSWAFHADVEYHNVEIEPRVVEAADALAVDADATGANVREFANRVPGLVEREVSWVRQRQVKLIYADIPFLAGYVGHAAGIPVIAGSNFTWNWILDGVPGIDCIVEGYRQCDLALRYPLSPDEGWDVFPRSEQVPLVTPRSERPREEIRSQLGIRPDQAVVLTAGRAPLSEEASERLRRECPDFVFLRADSLPSYHDLVRASDAVVSKAGYSTVAECIAEGVALLYPPRTGFREEGVLLEAARRLLRVSSIDVECWRSGDWGDALHHLLASPPPPDRIDTHGAQTCAEVILRTLS